MAVKRPNPKENEIYKHFKGSLYQIVTVAVHTETSEKMVVYRSIEKPDRVFARPLDMFMSEVDHLRYPLIRAKYRFTLMVEASDEPDTDEDIENVTAGETDNLKADEATEAVSETSCEEANAETEKELEIEKEAEPEAVAENCDTELKKCEQCTDATQEENKAVCSEHSGTKLSEKSGVENDGFGTAETPAAESTEPENGKDSTLEINDTSSGAQEIDDDTAVYKEDGELVIDPIVERVLDAKEFTDKIAAFELLRNKCTEEMLTTLAISLDVQLDGDTIEEKYAQILKTLRMHEKYESSRLRP